MTADLEGRDQNVYTVIALAFVGFLLIANVAATKLFALHPFGKELIFDGGALLFPLTYVLGDVLAEVFGFRRARLVIVMGFVLSAVAAGVFWIVVQLPAAPGYEHQSSFEAVLGFVPRIVGASLIAFLVGQLLNAYVLVWIKQRWGSRNLWVRLLGSSVVGEAADTAVFCTIAFYGILTGSEFWNYMLVGYLYKLAIEVILLPLSYPAVRWARRAISAPASDGSPEPVRSGRA